MKPLNCIVACVRGHYPSMHSSLTSTVCVCALGGGLGGGVGYL